MKTSILAITTVCVAAAATGLQARPGKSFPKPDPEETVIELFSGYDADDSGTLSAEELAAGLAGIHEARLAERKAKLQEMGISDEELEKRAEKRGGKGQPDPEKMASKLVEKFDASGDGELNAEELLEGLDSMKHRKHKHGPRPPMVEDAAE